MKYLWSGAGNGWGLLRALICAMILIYLVAPMMIVTIVSFSSAQYLTFPPPGFSFQLYGKLANNPAWGAGFMTSIAFVIPSALLATTVGTAAAIGISRGEFRGKWLLAGLLMSPLVVPVIITGAAMFAVFSLWGLVGSITGFVLAHTVLTIPYVISTVLASLKMLDPRFEQAAMTLGATRWVAFRRIMFPLIMPGILSGLLFATVMSFDELVVSLFLSTPQVRPLTVQMFSDLLGDVDPVISAIGTLLFLFSLLVLLLDWVTQAGRSQARPGLFGQPLQERR
jgi:putative spermidine/putrescine transport system permease protein